MFDEMKIKEGIVYDKHECKVVGFVDVGSVNNKLRLFEQSLADDGEEATNSIARHMLVFMVRDVFINLQFPYAQYPTFDLSADILYPLVWEVIRNLETVGFKVISLTGDKGSCNLKFFRLHKKVNEFDSEVTYKVPNPYTSEKRDIYFISDVPHLINCWSNSFCHNQARESIMGENKAYKHVASYIIIIQIYTKLLYIIYSYMLDFCTSMDSTSVGNI